MESKQGSAWVPRRMRSYADVYDADTDEIVTAPRTARGDQISKVGNNLMWSLVIAGKDWKRNRDKVWKEVQRSGYYACGIALLGTMFAVAQHELIFREYAPNGAELTILKLCNTVCSVLAVGAVYRIRWSHILLTRLRDHIDRGLLLHTEVTMLDVLSKRTIWIEIVLVALHLPPGCTFEFGTTTLKNYVVYRGETLFCLWNTLRIYLLWRTIRDSALNQIPQLFTIAHFTEVRLGSSYVTKRLLKSWASIFYIAAVWALVILLGAYWFRAMENTACLLSTTQDAWCQHRNARIWALQEGEEFDKINDLYLWNHIWLIFVVSTKGNNGIFRPTTHASRFVAACASTFGIILASLLTASLAQALTFNAKEDSTNLVIRRESARLQLKVQAVNMISRWFRLKTSRPLSKKQQSVLHSDMIKRFVETRRQALGDLDDLLGSSDKIDKLNLRTKRMEFALYHLAHAHELEPVTTFYADQDKEKTVSAPQVPKEGDADIDKHSVQETVVKMRRGSIGSIRDGAYSPTRATSSALKSPALSRKNSCDDLQAEDSSSRRRKLPPRVDPSVLAQIPPELLQLGGGPTPDTPPTSNAVHPFRADADLPVIEDEEEEPAQAAPTNPAPRGTARWVGDGPEPAGPVRAAGGGASELAQRVSSLEERVRAMHSSQESKIGRLEAQIQQLEHSQRESTAKILAALEALAGTPQKTQEA